MLADVVIRLIVTGIVAMVPSASDKDVTRLIAPNHMRAEDGSRGRKHHEDVPEHFAWVEVHSKNYVAGGTAREPDFRYHNAKVDADGDDRLVFILRSEKIEFETAHKNTTMVRNTTAPADLLSPSGPAERQSTAYILRMAQLCPKCKTIQEEYFDIRNRDRVAMRMDLRGGRVGVVDPRDFEVWKADGTNILQPLAQEVFYDFDVPGQKQTLLLTKQLKPDIPPDPPTRIPLQSLDGKPIEITVGNAPLVSILGLDKGDTGKHRDDHFALFYDMFTPAPPKHVVVEIDEARSPSAHQVRGPRDNCITPEFEGQDPKP